MVGRSYCGFFDGEGSFIVNKSAGEVNWMREDDGSFMLDASVPPPGYNDEHLLTGFSQASVAHKQLGRSPGQRVGRRAG